MQSYVTTLGTGNACVELDGNEHICTNINGDHASTEDWKWEGISLNKARLTLESRVSIS